MPVPTGCESLARNIRSLLQERAALLATLSDLPPRERWSRLGEVGELDQRIADERGRFETCLKEHHAAYRAGLTIIDTSPEPEPPRPRIAKLWRRRGEGSEVLEEVAFDQDAFTFTRLREANAPVGVTIHVTGDSRVKGADFRSGWLTGLPGTSLDDPDGRVEVVLRSASISSDAWRRWVASIRLPGTVPTPYGDVTLSLSGLRFDLATGSVNGRAEGTAKLPLSVGGMSVSFVFGASVQFSISPASPDPTTQCDVGIQARPTLTLGTTLGPVPQVIADTIRDTFATTLVTAIRDALNGGIPRAVAASFGLPELPPGAVPSLRFLEIAPGSISIGVALGGFGDVLSTFTP